MQLLPSLSNSIRKNPDTQSLSIILNVSFGLICLNFISLVFLVIKLTPLNQAGTPRRLSRNYEAYVFNSLIDS